MGAKSPDQFHRVLSKQLRNGMSLAILLSRLMVSTAGHGIAPLALTVLPRAMGWIARSTRIPENAVLQTQGWTTGA